MDFVVSVNEKLILYQYSIHCEVYFIFMKNLLTYGSLFAILFLLISCSSEAKKSYNQLRSEYEIVFVNSKSFEDIESFVSKLDVHLSQYPSYKGNEDLQIIKKQLINKREDIIYNDIQTSYETCFNTHFQSYEEITTKMTLLKDELAILYEKSTTTKNKQLVEKYLSEIVKALHNIAIEKQEYIDAVGSKDVVMLNNFIEKFPNSLLINNVKERVDDIYYTELLENTHRNIETIEDLNENLQLANEYSYKFFSMERKNSVSEWIEHLESRRKEILANEMVLKLDDLFEEMEIKARHVALQYNPGLQIEEIAVVSETQKEMKNSQNYTRIYRLKLSKDYLLFKYPKADINVEVVGRIQGDLQNGALIGVLDSKLI